MAKKFITAIRGRDASVLSKILPTSVQRQLQAYRDGEEIAEPLASIVFVLDVIRALLFQFERWRVSQRAAGVAFYLLIGFVPMIMMLVVATELIGLTDVVGEFIVDAIITNYIPIERSKALETIGSWVNNARTTIAGGIGLIGLGFAALNAFNGLYSLMNDLWQVPIRGRFAHRLRTAFSALFFIPATLFASTWLTTRFGGLHIIGPFASRFIAWLLVFVMAMFGLKVIIRLKVHWRSAAIAAAVGALAFEGAKTVFAFYVGEMLQGTWFAIYGAIFLFPVFLLWNLFTANIVAATASLGWIIQNPDEAFYDAGIPSPFSRELRERSSTETPPEETAPSSLRRLPHDALFDAFTEDEEEEISDSLASFVPPETPDER